MLPRTIQSGHGRIYTRCTTPSVRSIHCCNLVKLTGDQKDQSGLSDSGKYENPHDLRRRVGIKGSVSLKNLLTPQCIERQTVVRQIRSAERLE